MSRAARFHCPSAIAGVDGVELQCTGNGFDGYDSSKPVADQIDADVLLVYKPEDHLGVDQFKGLTVATYNECWPGTGKAPREVADHNLDLVVCHHQNDVPVFSGSKAKAVHIPHACRPELFCSSGDKDIDILFVGVRSAGVYPVRERLHRLVKSRWGNKRVCVVDHPGYRLRSKDECERQYVRYAQRLSKAKVVLTCSSKYKYALAKYFEGAMAGCTVVGDIPDQQDVISAVSGASSWAWVCDISGMTDDQIIDSVDDAVESYDARQSSSLRSLAKKCHSVEVYAERLCREIIRIM